MEVIKTIASAIGILCLAELGIIASIILFYIIREISRGGSDGKK